jgi:hypothetical protein
VWGARVAWAALFAAALVLGHAVAARGLGRPALQLFLTWTGLAAFTVAVLGANYAVTLFPRVEQARRLLGLSLALAVAASIMIPLMGWIVLLTAVLHSLRRVPRWTRLEAN